MCERFIRELFKYNKRNKRKRKSIERQMQNKSS